MKTRIIKVLALAAALLTLSGCAAKAAPDLRQVLEAITEQTELPAMAELSEKRMADRCGFSPETMLQAVVLVSQDGMRCDEIWLVEAPDEEKAEAVRTAAENRAAQLCRELKDYLPDQYAVAEKARIVRKGTVTALFIGPEAETMETILLDAMR